MMKAWLRPTTVNDSRQVANVYLRSRKAFIAFAPAAHSDDEVRKWMANVLIPAGGVMVAVQGPEESVVGMMALSRRKGAGWIEHLYLEPGVVGLGLGTRFIECAKKTLGSPIRLYTFRANSGARRFYERHGFQCVELTDGAGNEEHCPDMLYEWTDVTRRDNEPLG
jgi:GNAT superfamily N-acetyltransferase